LHINLELSLTLKTEPDVQLHGSVLISLSYISQSVQICTWTEFWGFHNSDISSQGLLGCEVM